MVKREHIIGYVDFLSLGLIMAGIGILLAELTKVSMVGGIWFIIGGIALLGTRASPGWPGQA